MKSTVPLDVTRITDLLVAHAASMFILEECWFEASEDDILHTHCSEHHKYHTLKIC
jgi:hypothetical protein